MPGFSRLTVLLIEQLDLTPSFMCDMEEDCTSVSIKCKREEHCNIHVHHLERIRKKLKSKQTYPAAANDEISFLQLLRIETV